MFPPAWCTADERLALEERAAIMEFDGGLSRADAEAAALALSEAGRPSPVSDSRGRQRPLVNPYDTLR